MLARTRIDPKQLSPYLTELHINTFLRVAEELRNGTIQRCESAVDGITAQITRSSNKFFHMSAWRCGSVHCIGGWIDAYMKDSDVQKIEYLCTRTDHVSPQLLELCVPLYRERTGTMENHKEHTRFWNSITPGHAATAIENVIYHVYEDGMPHWREVVEEE